MKDGEMKNLLSILDEQMIGRMLKILRDFHGEIRSLKMAEKGIDRLIDDAKRYPALTETVERASTDDELIEDIGIDEEQIDFRTRKRLEKISESGIRPRFELRRKRKTKMYSSMSSSHSRM